MASFKASDLTVTKTTKPKPKPAQEGLGFGFEFTDHMLVVEHVAGQGWGAPCIKPFGNLSLHPSAQVLHYGMSCFEGMKAFKGADGGTRLFRPQMNMTRFCRSCQRLMLPEFDPKELLECIKALVKIDEDWLPDGEGDSLYIRPTAMNTSGFVGLCPPNHTTIFVFLSPSNQFFKRDSTGETLYLNESYVRAWPGGVGDFKLASNYAGTLLPQVETTTTHGCIMPLFCLPHGPSAEDATVSEAMGMNIFFFLEKEDGTKELCTPPLDGTILPGINRATVIELCNSWGEFEVTERQITVGELKSCSERGRLLEAFGVGTAVTILPVVAIKREKGSQLFCKRSSTKDMQLTNRIRNTMFDIQFGRVEHEWAVTI